MPHTLRFGAALALIGALLLGIPAASHAALPANVAGQPLPSLAPMLEKVTPAVVNISTKTRVAGRDPYFDDPMFRLVGSVSDRVHPGSYAGNRSSARCRPTAASSPRRWKAGRRKGAANLASPLKEKSAW